MLLLRSNTHFYEVAPYGWAIAVVLAVAAVWYLVTRAETKEREAAGEGETREEETITTPGSSGS